MRPGEWSRATAGTIDTNAFQRYECDFKYLKYLLVLNVNKQIEGLGHIYSFETSSLKVLFTVYADNTVTEEHT
jgi:hypothetical protein